MDLSKLVKTGGFWNLTEVVGLISVQFIYIAVMARVLDKADFGILALVNSIIALGTIFSEGGMGAALIQKKTITMSHVTSAILGNMVISVLLISLSIVFAPTISNLYKAYELTMLIQVASVQLLLIGVSGVSLSLLYRSFNFKVVSLIKLFAASAGYISGIILAFNSYGVWSLVYATLISELLKTILFFYFSPFKFTSNISFVEWKELMSFGSGMILLRVTNYLSNSGMFLVVGKLLPFELLGIFERSSRLRSLPSSYLGGILDKVMFPVLSKIQNETERSMSIFKFGLGFSNSLLIPLTLLLIYFSDVIVLVLLGGNWTEAITPLRIMFMIVPLHISSRMADSLIRANGYVYKNFYRKLTFVFVLFFLLSVLSYYYGINGAALAVTISYIVNYILMIGLVIRLFKIDVRQILFKPLIPGFKLFFFCGLFLFFSHYLNDAIFDLSLLSFSISFIISFIIILVYLIFKVPSFFGEFISKVILAYTENNKKL